MKSSIKTYSRLGRRITGILTTLLLAGGFAYACVDSSTSTTTGVGSSVSSSTGGGQFDRNALLISLTDNVVLVSLDDFIVKTQSLRDATGAYAANLGETERSAAQQAWREAMASWQHIELMQVGPAGTSTDVVGGQDLRDEIYSWPIVNRCRVDQETVEANYSNVSAFASEPVNVRGLDALEHLLFETSATNQCPPQNIINTSGDWDGMVGELEQRRADYAVSLAQLLSERAQALRDAWSNGFADELKTAGQGSGPYASAHDALNAVSDAMFYIESETKDMKLAVPLGLSDCTETTCPDKLELTISLASKTAIESNLLAFEMMFMGGTPSQTDALGFDDWLVAYGAETLAQEMSATLAEAKSALAAIEEEDMALALQNDPQSVETLYFAIKGVTDKLKADVVTVLDLDLPNKVQGDND